MKTAGETIVSLLLFSVIFPNIVQILQQLLVTHACAVTEVAKTRCFADDLYLGTSDTCVRARTKRKTWIEANQTCSDKGQALVKIASETKEDDINDILTKADIGRVYYTGLNAIASEGTYVWASDGTQWKEGDFSNFGNDSWPTQKTPDENCIVKKKRSDWRWHLDACAHLHPFLCEYPSLPMPERPKLDRTIRDGQLFDVGSVLGVKCEANLSMQGKLRFLVYSKRRQTFIDTDNSRILSHFEDIWDGPGHTCESYANATLGLVMTRSLNGMTLACLSYINETVPSCSVEDPYCAIVGKISVREDSRQWSILTILPLIVLLGLPLFFFAHKMLQTTSTVPGTIRSMDVYNDPLGLHAGGEDGRDESYADHAHTADASVAAATDTTASSVRGSTFGAQSIRGSTMGDRRSEVTRGSRDKRSLDKTES